MQRERNEMHAGADSFAPQLLNRSLAVNLEQGEIEPEDVEVPGVLEAGSVRRKLHFLHPPKRLVVNLGVTSPSLDERIQLAQLVNPQRRLNVSQVVFEPRVDDFVIPAAALGVTAPRIAIHALERQ